MLFTLDENGSPTWSGLLSNTTINEDDLLERWFLLEQRWGESGASGITSTESPVTSESTFGHPNPVMVKWYFYRSEGGELLGIYATYTSDGQPRPFMLQVHPDHQRQGIATALVTQSYDEFGWGYDFGRQLSGLTATEAAASFADKFINNQIGK